MSAARWRVRRRRYRCRARVRRADTRPATSSSDQREAITEIWPRSPTAAGAVRPPRTAGSAGRRHRHGRVTTSGRRAADRAASAQRRRQRAALGHQHRRLVGDPARRADAAAHAPAAPAAPPARERQHHGAATISTLACPTGGASLRDHRRRRAVSDSAKPGITRGTGRAPSRAPPRGAHLQRRPASARAARRRPPAAAARRPSAARAARGRRRCGRDRRPAHQQRLPAAQRQGQQRRQEERRLDARLSPRSGPCAHVGRAPSRNKTGGVRAETAWQRHPLLRSSR